ncbi:class II fructose-bisphosphatase [Patulibacter brassicae]|jgi:fructose-1,6-bisphosphatase II|uniref:Fructose-1,6-bisphosphatase n=1 Tax=Patulibacter brassicae TaxID=1705717 RepID=A0ABU4VHS1_9ACTN|nr:class II fructose-bisphosphatase [Patulibacter brassicae]MDX8151372.1 class II fructose-bisphosphatase [Patulibacter brassicae]
MTTTPDRTLAMELVRTTEAAALAASRLAGRGDKNAADQAAVDGMRYVLDTVAMDGVVVIGEGEKDEAPMLYNGEHVGNGEGPQVDIAVDPLEGTTLTAKGQPNALSVIAIAPRGSMFDPGPCVYMEKLAGGRDVADLLDLDRPLTETAGLIAERRGKDISEVLMITLDRPRHQEQIEAVRAAGAKVRLISDGDVAGSLLAVMSDSAVDFLWGVGGTPEGVISAAAIKCISGRLVGRLWPRDDAERQAALDAGYDLERQLDQNDLVKADQCLFSATGVTDGELLQGVRRRSAGGATTESVVMRAGSDTIRRVHAQHRPEKLSSMPGAGPGFAIS